MGNSHPAALASEMAIFQIIYAFHMPLFFLISGYLYSLAYFDSECRPKSAKLRTQLLDIAAVYVVFSALLVAFKVLFSGQVYMGAHFSDLLQIWRRPIQLYWYLYVLAIFYVVCIPVGRAGRRALTLIVGGAAVLSAVSDFIGLPSDFCVWRVCFQSVFFIMGIALQRKALEVNWGVAICGLLVAVGLSVAFWSSDLASCAAMVHNVSVVSTVVAIGASLFNFKAFSAVGRLDCGLLRLLGAYCLEIYVLHTFLVAGFRSAFAVAGVTNFWLSFALNTVLSTALPVLAALVLKRMGVHDVVFRPAHWLSRRLEGRSGV